MKKAQTLAENKVKKVKKGDEETVVKETATKKVTKKRTATKKK